jgi:hypothetical protein
MTLVLNDDALVIRSGSGRWRLPTLPEADFPHALETGPDAVRFTLSAADARRLHDRLHYAISDEETRYYLTGVNIQERDKKLACAATDGHMLAEILLDVDPKRDPSVIIPARAVEALKAIAAIGNVDVSNRQCKGLRLLRTLVRNIETDRCKLSCLPEHRSRGLRKSRHRPQRRAVGRDKASQERQRHHPDHGRWAFLEWHVRGRSVLAERRRERRDNRR